MKEINNYDDLDANEENTEINDQQSDKPFIQNHDKGEDISMIKKIEEVPNNEIDDDFVFSFKSEKEGIICGATTINDR